MENLYLKSIELEIESQITISLWKDNLIKKSLNEPNVADFLMYHKKKKYDLDRSIENRWNNLMLSPRFRNYFYEREYEIESRKDDSESIAYCATLRKLWMKGNTNYNYALLAEKKKNFSYEAYLGEPKRTNGGKKVWLCPLGHIEKNPSFTVFPDNHFYCFSCCEGGDPITFVMKMENCDFKRALNKLY
jgi:hypothetical protein